LGGAGAFADQPISSSGSAISNRFEISTYKPNYVLPFYYTKDPDYSVYSNVSDNQDDVKKTEVKFQISLKVLLARKFIIPDLAFFVAYSQLSYWQAYASSAYFRETNFEPEAFVSREFNTKLPLGIYFNQLNAGFVHQSNGRGGVNERSWNRIYGDFCFQKDFLSVSIKPWIVFHGASYRRYNPDMTDYLGHGRLKLIYKTHNLVFTLMSRNNIESGFKRGTVDFTFSFPLFKPIRGYVEIFNGYGQSLIEYNHQATSAGIGFALNDD